MKKILSSLFITLFLHAGVSWAEGGISLNQLDIEYGDGNSVGDDRFYRVDASVYGELFNRNFLQLDVGRTEFDNTGLNAFSAYFIHRNNHSMWALGYRRQELDVFESDHLNAQYQYYQDDFLTVVGMLGREDKNIANDHNYGALYLRMYPSENLMIQTGPSFYHSLGSDFGSEDIELDLTIEWQPGASPIPWLTVFYEETLFGDNSVGVRLRLEKAPLRIIHRSGGIMGF